MRTGSRILIWKELLWIWGLEDSPEFFLESQLHFFAHVSSCFYELFYFIFNFKIMICYIATY